MPNTEIIEALLKSGAFEDDHPEFDLGEYRGVEKVAEKLHKQAAAIRPAGDDTVEKLSQKPDITTILEERLTREHQQKIVEELRNHSDKVWHMDAFEDDGKYNCLRVTEKGSVFLDIIKPGVHESYMVKLQGNISPELIAPLRVELQTNPREWEKVLPQGFLPAGVTEHNAESQFDENGGTRPGAVFVADRVFDLNVLSYARRAVLRWKVKHTNPNKRSEEGGAFKVEDILTFEWESLPTH